MGSTTETDLIIRIRCGNKQAEQELLNRYIPRIVKKVRFALGARNEDLLRTAALSHPIVDLVDRDREPEMTEKPCPLLPRHAHRLSVGQHSSLAVRPHDERVGVRVLRRVVVGDDVIH